MTPFALGPRAIAVWNLWRHMRLRVEGMHHLPASGGALIAARHYHHAFDGSALVAGLPRQPHLFVALDWTSTRWERCIMEAACRLAEWPVTLRSESFAADGGVHAFDRHETRRYVRRAIDDGAELLRRGKVLAVFPEGFPTIDPVRSHKTHDDEFLPFRPGILALAARAERSGGRIPIVPAGLAYTREGERFRVTLRLGAPVFLERDRSRDEQLRGLESRVKALSR